MQVRVPPWKGRWGGEEEAGEPVPREPGAGEEEEAPPSPRSPHASWPARRRRRGEERSRRPWHPPSHASVLSLSSLSARGDPRILTDGERRGPGGGKRG